MSISEYANRAVSYIGHYLSAKNTLGYGVHSPYLYNIVRYVLNDENRYYCFMPIEQERMRLMRATKQVKTTDFGTGTSGNYQICDIANRCLQSREDAQRLFKLANFVQPKLILELGTSLGITTAYLASVDSRAKVYTLEGSHSLAQEARNVFERLKINNIELIEGNIDDSLPVLLDKIDNIDFALIDANHRKEPTFRYFQLIKPKLTQQSVLVFDDIHHSTQMQQAWEMITEDTAVTATIDAYNFGIAFFDKYLEKKNYKIRL